MRDSLILVYIGHGEFPDERSGDFYPCRPTRPGHVGRCDPLRGFHQRLHQASKGLRRPGRAPGHVPRRGGGLAVDGAMGQSLRGNVGFVLLTATDDRKTAGAPLTRAAIDLLERGDPEAAGATRCEDVYRRLKEEQRCASQLVKYNAGDDRHYLGGDIARDPGDVFWKNSEGRAQILKQTEYFQPTPQLSALVKASGLIRWC